MLRAPPLQSFDFWRRTLVPLACCTLLGSRAVAAPAAGAAYDRPSNTSANEYERQRWMVTLEGYTRAPVDLGLQLGLEVPFGLRVSTGFGWVPSAYMGLVTSAIASTTDDARAEVFLEGASYDGRSWSAQVGYRPFRSLGFYVDAGYSRLTLDGTGVVTDEMSPELAGAEGRYEAHTALDLWSLVLGYELQPVKQLVLGAGLGVLGTLSANTTATSTNPRANAQLLADAARRFDRGLTEYGLIPTLSLRAGFDFY